MPSPTTGAGPSMSVAALALIATAIKRSNNLTKFCLTPFKYPAFQSISYASTYFIWTY